MYATTQDMIDLHGADFVLMVANRGDEQALSDPLTVAAMADGLLQASSECDGYLSVRYAVPLVNCPAIVKNHTINIAVYQMASTADRMTDIIRERYKNAISYLKDVSAGRANLPLGAGTGVGGEGTTSQAAPNAILIDSNSPQFKRGRF